jgi:tetratricopeptide (TPR) repeat protein
MDLINTHKEDYLSFTKDTNQFYLIDLGYKNLCPIKNYTNLFIIDIPQEIYSDESYDILVNLEEDIINICKTSNYIYIGHCLSDTLKLYIYSNEKKSKKLNELSIELKTNYDLFLDIEIISDNNWNIYLDELCPSNKEEQEARELLNIQNKCYKSIENGDNPDKIRKINFIFSIDEKNIYSYDINGFSDYLNEIGFSSDIDEESESVIATHYLIPEVLTIKNFISSLKKICISYGFVYKDFNFKIKKSYTIQKNISSQDLKISEQLYNKSLNLYNNNNYDLSLEFLKKSIDLNPNDSTLYNFLGIQYYENENYIKAIKNFETAIEITPDMKDSIYNKANCLFELELFSLADEFYTKVLNLDEDYVDALISKSHILLLNEKIENAKSLANRAKLIDPKNEALIELEETIDEYELN